MVFRLKKGDQIDILAPGSFIDEDENLQKGIEILKNLGLEINKSNSLLKKLGYFFNQNIFQFSNNRNSIFIAYGSFALNEGP